MNNYGQRRNPIQQQVQINPDDLSSFACPQCGEDLFEPAFRIFEIPELMRAMCGGANTLNAQIWSCKGCGHATTLDKMARMTPQDRIQSQLVSA